MPSVRKPSLTTIENFLDRQAKLGFMDRAVGATASRPPDGYTVDHTRLEIGHGETDFVAATEAMQRWEHFRVGWVEACPPDTPIRAGLVVAVVARIFGLWCINACRIVYVVDDDGATAKHGFAYGTLPDHVESGEERFLIEWIRRTIVCGMTSCRFRVRSRFKLAWAIPSSDTSKNDSDATRLHRC
jgi:uncharacterized protein (UPF0548 family)